MAVTITKAKDKAVAAATAIMDTLKVFKSDNADKVDPLRELAKQIDKQKKELKKLEAQYKEMLAPISAKVEELVAAGEEFTLFNAEQNHYIEFGVKAQSRVITDKAGLIKALEAINEDLPFELAEFKLGDIDKYLSEHEQKKYITTKQEGSRKVSFKEA